MAKEKKTNSDIDDSLKKKLDEIIKKTSAENSALKKLLIGLMELNQEDKSKSKNKKNK